MEGEQMITSKNGTTEISNVTAGEMLADLGVIVVSVIDALVQEFDLTEEAAFMAVVSLITVTTPKVMAMCKEEREEDGRS